MKSLITFNTSSNYNPFLPTITEISKQVIVYLLPTDMILYPADTYMIGTELTNNSQQTFFIETSFGMELVIDNN